MGQLLSSSSEEELPRVKDALGCLLYDTMLEGGAVPDLAVVHPLHLTNQDESFESRSGLQEQLRQLQGDLSNRAPTYLRDLIGRLSSFSDEPRMAGLVGLVVTMLMDMAYTSSRQASGGKGKSAGSSSCQRIQELQEVMEEYLKRCRINLSDKGKLIEDSIRLEAQFSLILTQLKACLLGGDCDSRSLRHWASGAAFHTQMLLHLARLEGKAEPLGARAVLEQYKDDLTQILPAYRRYKSHTVSVLKCRGALLASRDPSEDTLEEGSMTGLTVTDRETGKSATVPLSAMETAVETFCQERRKASEPGETSAAVSPSINLDLITSEQYARAYLDRLFSDKGAVAELEDYFTRASENLRALRIPPGCKNKTAERDGIERNDGACAADEVEGITPAQLMHLGKDDKSRARRDEAAEEARDESLKLSIVETQPDQSLDLSPT